MYQLTEIQKHNLEMNVLNAAMTIQSLYDRVKILAPEHTSPTAEEVLVQLQNAQRTLDNLTPFVSEWQDRESDVHNTL